MAFAEARAAVLERRQAVRERAMLPWMPDGSAPLPGGSLQASNEPAHLAQAVAAAQARIAPPPTAAATGVVVPVPPVGASPGSRRAPPLRADLGADVRDWAPNLSATVPPASLSARPQSASLPLNNYQYQPPHRTAPPLVRVDLTSMHGLFSMDKRKTPTAGGRPSGRAAGGATRVKAGSAGEPRRDAPHDQP